ncbi:MAG TPA: hypothetical protein VGH33_27810 [Isosphaeraceae bacterium]
MSRQRTKSRSRRPVLEGLETRALLNASFIENLPGTPQLTVSTIPASGDLNPYGVAFVPAKFPSNSPIHPGDVLVSNFNAGSNLQGTGSTIVDVAPSGKVSTFFQGAPGLGLTTALGVLQRGIVIVGALPTTDGTSATVGQGSILLINRFGQEIANISNQTFLNGPWDMTVVDHGATASVFISSVLSGAVSRIDVWVPQNGSYVVVKDAVQIASGYTHRTDPSALVLGPTGLAYDTIHDVLYVASTADNAIYALPHAGKSKGDHGVGIPVFADPTYLHGPLGLVLAQNGNLIAANGDAINPDPNQQSEIVEFTPYGKFVAQFSLDPGNAAAPFGITTTTNRQNFVYFAAVNDVTNQLEVFWFHVPHNNKHK